MYGLFNRIGAQLFWNGVVPQTKAAIAEAERAAVLQKQQEQQQLAAFVGLMGAMAQSLSQPSPVKAAPARPTATTIDANLALTADGAGVRVSVTAATAVQSVFLRISNGTVFLPAATAEQRGEDGFWQFSIPVTNGAGAAYIAFKDLGPQASGRYFLKYWSSNAGTGGQMLWGPEKSCCIDLPGLPDEWAKIRFAAPYLAILNEVALADGAVNSREDAWLRDVARKFGIDSGDDAGASAHIFESEQLGQFDNDFAILKYRDFDLDDLLQDCLDLAAVDGLVVGSEFEILARLHGAMGLTEKDWQATLTDIYAAVENPETGPKLADLAVARGMEQQTAGAHESARDVFSALLDHGFVDEEIYRLRARSRVALGEKTEATKDLRDAVRVGIDSQPARVELALHLASDGDYVGALPHLDAAIELVPNDADARVWRAGVLSELGQHAAAARDMAVAVKLCPERADLRRWQAEALWKSGQKKSAMVSISQAVQDFQMDPESLLCRAKFHREGQNPADALADLRAAFEIASEGPISAAVSVELGWILQDQRRFAEARTVLDVAAGAAPDNWAVGFCRGCCLLQLDANVEAYAQLTKCAELQPADCATHALRAQAAMDLDRTSEAEADLEICAGIGVPEGLEALVMYVRGRIHLAKGDRYNAWVELSAAIQADPTSSNAYFHRAKVFIAQNQLDLAVADLDSAIDHDGDYVDAIALRGRLHFDRGDLENARTDNARATALKSAAKATAR